MIPRDPPAAMPLKALRAIHDVLREDTQPARPLRIVDVGANPVNTPDYAGLLAMGWCEVWGFEPNETAFAALQAEPVEGAHYFNSAVGAPGPSEFHVHPQSALSSGYPVSGPSARYLGRPLWAEPETGAIETVQMDLVALDDLDDLPAPDVLKIDIQGGELDVFRHGRKKLAECVAVVSEVRFYRIYEDEPLWAEVDLELRSQGFALNKIQFAKTTTVKNSRRRWLRHRGQGSQMVDGDAVYIRNPEGISEWSDEQVRQLAIAAGCVFQSHDVACMCLDELVRRDLAPSGVTRRYVNALPRYIAEAAE
ncbi:MAG: FkbM family methyltransferase [Paracoccaceae bacterium]